MSKAHAQNEQDPADQPPPFDSPPRMTMSDRLEEPSRAPSPCFLEVPDPEATESETMYQWMCLLSRRDLPSEVKCEMTRSLGHMLEQTTANETLSSAENQETRVKSMTSKDQSTPSKKEVENHDVALKANMPRNISPMLHAQTVLDSYIYLPAANGSINTANHVEHHPSLSSCSSGIRLPVLNDFNKAFKRGYGIMIWIRPGVTVPSDKMPEERNPVSTDGMSVAGGTAPSIKSAQQTLFRIATGDSRTFLQCTLSTWETDHETGYATTKIILSVGGASHGIPGSGGSHHRPHPSTSHHRAKHGKPSHSQSHHINQHAPNHRTPLPIHVATGNLTLPIRNGEWQLLSISHSNPYLKRPRFTMTLSGDPILDAECPYPLIQDPVDVSSLGANGATSWLTNSSSDLSYHPSSTKSSNSNINNKIDMDDLILLHNLHIPVLCGGCAIMQEPFPNEPVAILGELGPCAATVLSHPPPVPLNRDAATVSVHPGVHHSLGMVSHTNVSRFHSTRKKAAQQSKQSTKSHPPGGPVFGNTSATSPAPGGGRVQVEYARIGIPSCKEGIRGADMVQLLRSKLVYEFNPHDAPETGHHPVLSKEGPGKTTSVSQKQYHQRVVIPPTFACGKVGTTENVRLGLVEPNPGNFHILQATGNVSQTRANALSLLGDGCIVSNADLVPQYWPQVMMSDYRIIPWPGESIVMTHVALHSLSLCVLPMRLGLSSLGEPYYEKEHKARMQQTQEEMLRALMNHNGVMCGELLRLIGSLLRSSGEIREEAVQSGFMYVLTGLLRRVVRRAHLFHLITASDDVPPSPTSRGGETGAVVPKASALTSGVDGAIYHVPLPIVRGAISVISACCGGIYNRSMAGPVSNPTVMASGSPDRQSSLRHLHAQHSMPASLILRRNSDLALQCLHGFCFQFCLWGANAEPSSATPPSSPVTTNWKAASLILSAVTKRYCPTSTRAMLPNPYGIFLRNHMSAQTLMDMIQYHYALPDSSHSPENEFNYLVSAHMADIASCSENLSSILTALLQVSLNDTSEQGFSRCDQDMEACISALSSSSLGSFAAGIILKALHAILAKCTSNSPLQWYAYPDHDLDMKMAPEEQQHAAAASMGSPRAQQNQRDQVSYRIARKLKLCEFDSVVGPMLLSRVISCGSVARDDTATTATSVESDATTNDSKTGGRGSIPVGSKGPEQGARLTPTPDSRPTCNISASAGSLIPSCLDWRLHWRRTLLLWVWLLTSQNEKHSAGAAGSGPNHHDKVARHTCALLLASAKTGALEGCLSQDMIRRLLPYASQLIDDGPGSNKIVSPPPITRPTVGFVSMDRVKVMLPLTPALVATLVSDPPHPNTADSILNEADIVLCKQSSILLYKLVFALHRSIDAVLEASFRQAGKGKQSSSEYYTIMSSSLSVVPPLKKLLAFTEWSSDTLTQVAMLLQPYCASANTKKSSSRPTSNWKAAKHDIPNIKVETSQKSVSPEQCELETDDPWVMNVKPRPNSLSPYFEPMPNQTLMEMSQDEVVQECFNIVETTLCNLLSSVIKHTSNRPSPDGDQAGVGVWKSVLRALDSAKQEDILKTVTADESPPPLTQEEVTIDGSLPDTTMRVFPSKIRSAAEVRLLCHLSSAVLDHLCDDGAHEKKNETSKAQRGKERPIALLTWSSEICSAVTRLATLVQERQLFLPLDTRNSTALDSAQVILFQSMLRVLKHGREQMGWCQLSALTSGLPPPPSSVASPLAQASFTNKGHGVAGPESVAELTPEHVETSARSGTSDDFFRRMESFAKNPVASSSQTSSGDNGHRERRASSSSASPDKDQQCNFQSGSNIRRHNSSSNSSSQPDKNSLSNANTFEQTSKKYQPFLRCFLNCAMRALPYVSSTTPPDQKCSELLVLWTSIRDELKATYTAAIVGLSFPCARDVGLGGLADLRSAVGAMTKDNDEVVGGDDQSIGYTVCCELVVLVVEELHERHVIERTARKGDGHNGRTVDGNEKSSNNSTQKDVEDDDARDFVQQMIIGPNPFPSKVKGNIERTARVAKEMQEAAIKKVFSKIEAETTAGTVEETISFSNSRDEDDDVLYQTEGEADSLAADAGSSSTQGRSVPVNCSGGLFRKKPAKIITKSKAHDDDDGPPVLTDAVSFEDDFIMYTDALKPETSDLSKLPEILQNAGSSQLQWTNYAGFYNALEKCRRHIHHSSTEIDALAGDGEIHDAKPPARSDEDHSQTKVDSLFEAVGAYLDVWDDNTIRDGQFAIVELFDSSTTAASHRDGNNKGALLSDSFSSDSLNDTAGMHINNSNANLMAHFIELASGEKNRVAEGKGSVLATLSESMDAAAEEFCKLTHHHMHSGYDGVSEGQLLEPHGERGIGDGGKDVYSRFVSYPIHRCFRRFVPDYLDHSGMDQNQHQPAPSPSREGEIEHISYPNNKEHTSIEDGDNDNEQQLKKCIEPAATEVGASAGLDSSVSKDLLNISTKVKIVDITKTVAEAPSGEDEMIDDDADFDENGLDIGFVDRSTFMKEKEPDPPRKTKSIAASTTAFPSNASSLATDQSSAVDINTHTTDGVSSLDTDEQSNTIKHAYFDDEPIRQESSTHPIAVSSMTSFALPPAVTMGTGLPVECHWDNVIHVRAEGSRKATLLLTGSQFILEYESELFDGEELAIEEHELRKNQKDSWKPSTSSSRISGNGESEKKDDGGDGDDEESGAAMNRHHYRTVMLRPKVLRWAIAECTQIFLRRFRLRDSAMELFFVPSGGSGGSIPSVSIFIDFGPGRIGNARRDLAAGAIMKRAPHQCIKQWPERFSHFVHEHRHRLTAAWVDGRLSNFDYLLHLNNLAGRTFNDLCQYPVMPWVLSNYTSDNIPDLTDKSNFRDLSKPMGALNPNRLEDFIERFETFQDPSIPPFMYGSHYSTSAGVVLHFLVRTHPFAGLHRQLQNGHFDVADRLFSSVPRTWDVCTGSSVAEVKELTPEWYCYPSFLRNANGFKLGTSQDGDVLGDVVLPPWADSSPEKFVEVMRAAMESDVCSEMLPDWIDLIFGYKQQGPEAVKANNVFFYLTYYGSVDVASIEDEALRTATELQIAHFGQCPMQLFWRPHPRKRLRRGKGGFSEALKLHEKIGAMESQEQVLHSAEGSHGHTEVAHSHYFPFRGSPLSHWVNLAAPPPGPHAPLVAVRLAGLDRCLTVDGQGIFHCFRWTWKPDDVGVDGKPKSGEDGGLTIASGRLDKGCFVAQRELPHFRSIPRLPYNEKESKKRVVVALSKTLFASRTLLLALSDGDGEGALAMQFVDPVKGLVKGETVVPGVHSKPITAIAMDPLGVATGGGAGGELAIVGSADGSASLWRFISSHYLPLRPKQRMRGHEGTKISAVVVSSAMNICATISKNRCCIFNLGNGSMLKSIRPPENPFLHQDNESGMNFDSTVFAETSAACFSVLGFIVLVCTSKIGNSDEITTLQLFSLEGVRCASKAITAKHGLPVRIMPTFDGRAILVSRKGGVDTYHVSLSSHLERVDEWEIHGKNPNMAVHDMDLGPSLFRPILAAASCSDGSLRLHALPGISAWSEANKKGTMTEAVEKALAKPAQKLKKAGGFVKVFGASVMGLGKELAREASSDVKERGMTGFLGGVFKKGQNQSSI